MNKDKVTVRLHVEASFANADLQDDIEIDRSEWEAMTQEEKDQFLNDEAVEFKNNYISCAAWVIEEKS